MPEPSSLSTVLAEFIASHEPGTRLHDLGQTLLRAHTTNQDRRSAVLRHDDLAARLTKPPLGYARPEQWNGYLPPAMVNPGPSEPCYGVQLTPGGGIRFRHNQLGRRSAGEIPNDSPARAALLAISREAWERDQAIPKETPDE